MYLKEIRIDNTGPIEVINKTLPFHDNGNPKPFVIIGKNGAGKSIFLAQIVNALMSAKQTIYNDNEVEEGKVYKYRSPSYIKNGKTYAYTKLIFEDGLNVSECQLNSRKTEYEKNFIVPDFQEWGSIPQNETSYFNNNFSDDTTKVKNIFDSNCILYFPPNRFEEPGWLNVDNLINKADYRFIKRLSNISNRNIINYAPLKDNQNWLLDLLFDKTALEIKTVNISIAQDKMGNPINVPVFTGFEGESNNINNEIIKFIKVLFQIEGNIRFGIGKRRNRQVHVLKDDQPFIQNLFNLSTGETILLNIFLTIIKDFDLSNVEINQLSDIRGIVIIDEIDLHLHTNFQYVVLPKLIKLFPKIQFILTSHAPLFLLGLKNELGEENFEIINLPDANRVNVEEFSEFEMAYTCFKETEKYSKEIKSIIEESNKSLLFVEGDYDIKYLNKAAEVLGKQELLSCFKLVDAEGHGNLTNIAKHFDSKLADVTPQKIVLLYDCDQQKNETTKGNVMKRVMPIIDDNPIKRGIENLFPADIINRAMQNKTAFIDVTKEIKRIVRGIEEIVPEKLEVNKDEKRNLCEWIILNGTESDFEYFLKVFDILEKIKNE